MRPTAAELHRTLIVDGLSHAEAALRYRRPVGTIGRWAHDAGIKVSNVRAKAAANRKIMDDDKTVAANLIELGGNVAALARSYDVTAPTMRLFLKGIRRRRRLKS